VTASQTGGPGDSESLDFCLAQQTLNVTGPDLCLDVGNEVVACDAPEYDHSAPFDLTMQWLVPKTFFECCCDSYLESDILVEHNYEEGTAVVQGGCALPEYVHLSSEWCVNVHFPNKLYCEECDDDVVPPEFMPWSAVLKKVSTANEPPRYEGAGCSLLPQALWIEGGEIQCFPYTEAVIEIDPDNDAQWRLSLNGDIWVGYKYRGAGCTPNPGGAYSGGAGDGCTLVPLNTIPGYQAGFWKDLGRIYARSFCAEGCPPGEICWDCENCGTCPECSPTDRWGAPGSVNITVASISCGVCQDVLSMDMTGGTATAPGYAGCGYKAVGAFTMHLVISNAPDPPIDRYFPVDVRAVFQSAGNWHVYIDWIDDTNEQQPTYYTYDGETQDGLTCCQGGSGETFNNPPDHQVPCCGAYDKIAFSVDV
jgi:hypothetical protein